MHCNDVDAGVTAPCIYGRDPGGDNEELPAVSTPIGPPSHITAAVSLTMSGEHCRSVVQISKRAYRDTYDGL